MPKKVVLVAICTIAFLASVRMVEASDYTTVSFQLPFVGQRQYVRNVPVSTTQPMYMVFPSQGALLFQIHDRGPTACPDCCGQGCRNSNARRWELEVIALQTQISAVWAIFMRMPGLICSYSVTPGPTVNMSGCGSLDLTLAAPPMVGQISFSVTIDFLDNPRIVHSGHECVDGSGNQPKMGWLGEPVLGSQFFFVTVENVPASVVCYLVLTPFNLDPPVSLEPLGLGRECYLQVSTTSAPAILLALSSGGSAVLHLPLPADPIVRNIPLYCQWAIQDGATPLPWRVSHALKFFIE